MTLPDADTARGLLRHMLRIRAFEDACAELYSASKIRGFMHLYNGEEAIAAGIVPLLEPADAIVATYREHGHALVRGVELFPGTIVDNVRLGAKDVNDAETGGGQRRSLSARAARLHHLPDER